MGTMGTAEAQLNFLDPDLDILLQMDSNPILEPLSWLTEGTSHDSLGLIPCEDLSPSNVLDGVPVQFPTSSTDEDLAPRKAAEQKERIKAKNRRAQNKYREKQKAKMKTTEQQVADMEVELDRLRLENARLQQQSAVGEKVLAVRDFAVGTLEAGRDAAAASRQGQQPSPAAQESPPADTCDLAICPFSDGGGCPVDSMQVLGVDIEALKQMTPEALQAQWKGIVQRLSDVLAASAHLESSGEEEGGGQDDALSAVLEEHVRPILSEASMVCFEHAVCNPSNIQKLLARALDDGKSGQSEDNMQKWAAVVAALRLRPDQRQKMAAFREVFLRRMGRVLDERRSIFDRLGGLEAPDGLRAMRTTTEIWLKTHEATQELSANIDQEHVVGMEFLAAVMGRVLNSTQKAAAIVHSWPFFPDVYSICTAAVAAQPPLLEAAGS